MKPLAEKLCLAIESSCDETSVALVRGDGYVRKLLVASQIAEHRPFGGVVPELASRGHLRRILPLVDDAIRALDGDNDHRWTQIDFLAVTQGPGLIGSLLVGTEAAKTLAWVRGKPLLGVNHLAGHIASIALWDDRRPAPDLGPADWPRLSLIVSGGHTSLILQEAPGAPFRRLGQTLDDAIGEAYDKVAKLLGLGYPGGPIIDRLCKDAPTGPGPHEFPRPMMDRPGYEFSYSGLKTAVVTAARRLHDEPHKLPDEAKRDLCVAFQEAAIDCLMIRLAAAVTAQRPRVVGVVGGVACNARLRERLGELAATGDVKVLIPAPIYCTDNAAMIAAAAFAQLAARARPDAPPVSDDLRTLDAASNLPLVAVG